MYSVNLVDGKQQIIEYSNQLHQLAVKQNDIETAAFTQLYKAHSVNFMDLDRKALLKKYQDILKTYNLKDSLLVNIYLDIFEHDIVQFRGNYLGNSFIHDQKLINHLDTLSNSANFTFEKSLILSKLTQGTDSLSVVLSFAKQSLQLLKEHNYPPTVSYLLDNLAINLMDSNDSQLVENLFHVSEQLALAEEDKNEIYYVKIRYVEFLLKNNQLKKGLKYLEELSPFKSNKKLKAITINTYEAIAFAKLGNIEKAINSIEITKKLALQNDFTQFDLNNLYNYIDAFILIHQGDIKQGTYILEKYWQKISTDISNKQYNQIKGVKQLLNEVIAKEKAANVLAAKRLEYFQYGIFVLIILIIILFSSLYLLFQSRKKIQKMSQIDGLTQFLNREHLDLNLSNEYSRLKRLSAKKKECNGSIIMFDIDNFKGINDTYGHALGDIAIKTIAKITKKSIRSIDKVGRYGGDEFIIMLTDSNHQEALQFSERLRVKIQNSLITHKDHSTKITCSFGIASFDTQIKSAAQWVEEADQALYSAKKQGRNQSSLSVNR